MQQRRQFLKATFGFLTGMGVLLSPVFGAFRLAYGVNGRILPKKHGFPLRIVAEGYYGYNWVKYAYRVNVV